MKGRGVQCHAAGAAASRVAERGRAVLRSRRTGEPFGAGGVEAPSTRREGTEKPFGAGGLVGRAKRCTARGFTLVEMLVATAIFALAAALAWGGLRSVVEARAVIDAQNERLGRLQFAVGMVERDLRSVVARGVRDNYGAVLPALAGARDRIEFSHLRVASVLAPQRSQIERVGYRVVDGELQRWRWQVLDRAPGSQPQRDPLLDQVDELRLVYLSADGRELAQWPLPDAIPDLPPRAVEVTLKLKDYGEIRRVLELPHEEGEP